MTKEQLLALMAAILEAGALANHGSSSLSQTELYVCEAKTILRKVEEFFGQKKIDEYGPR